MECLPCIFHKIENNNIQQMHFSMFIMYTSTPTCFGPSGPSSGSYTVEYDLVVKQQYKKTVFGQSRLLKVKML
jgi:hypothetical protein